MPEMSTRFVPKHMNDTNPDPRLLKLLTRITDRIPAKIAGVKVSDPEYWGIACIFEDEMEPALKDRVLDLMLKMKIRKKYTLPEMLALGADQELLDKVSRLGLMEYDYGDKYTKDGPIPGTTYTPADRHYWIPLFVPGSGEYTNMDPALMDRHPELAMFFERMTFLPLEHVTAMVPPGGAGIGMHVIPVEKAISMENTTMDIEHISYWLKKYEGHIGASICSCRHGRGKMDEGCADDYNDWCIGVGDMADWCRETGRGHDITYEQAMEILQRAEDNGFVHQVTNIDGENKIFAICNCNVKICNALRTSQLFNTPNMSASAYRAHVEKSKCVACGGCVEVCPAGAVKLGQKLCKKDGSEVQYPKQELPDAKKWGKDKWTEDYRDKNRINTHESGTAPCKTACPAHIAVQGYLKKASQGKYQEALAIIKKENPFPAVCGRVCNRRCEDACTRGKIDQAIAIDAVKKFIAEQDLKAETRYVPKVVIANNLKERWDEKIAIIGGGPAGLSAAFYLAQMGYLPTVFEKNERAGGMLTYGIPSYKLEKDVIDAEIEIMKELGVEIRLNTEVGKDVTIASLREEGYKAFYIAIGCQGGRLPGIPGETAEGTMTAIDYLKDANTGNTHFEGEVVVVGGGNVAIDASRVSARSGASKVTQLCLETEDIMPATKEEIFEAREDGVTINCGWGPKEVLTENGKVTGIVFKKCTRVYDENKKFAPEYDENETITLKADRVIFAIGQATVWGDLLKDTGIELNRGRIAADAKTYQTTCDDIFVGGDVYTGPKFAIDAIAAGKEAAESLHRFVQHGHMTIGRNPSYYKELNKDDILVESYDTAGRQDAGMVADIDPKSFRDAHATLTEEQVRIETARCLGCGAAIVDINRCIGCGLCTTKCKFDAITLHRDVPEASNMRVAEDKFKYILPYAAKRAVKIVTSKK